MFYEPKKKNHGLPKNPFNSLVIPRPIGWISSIDTKGKFNLAPYSFFNGVCYSPPTVMFSAGAGANSDNTNDSARNAENTGDFPVNAIHVTVNLYFKNGNILKTRFYLNDLEILPGKSIEEYGFIFDSNSERFFTDGLSQNDLDRII